MVRRWDTTTYPPIILRPGPTLTFPKIAWVPKDSSLFNREGMLGWFEQSHKEVGTLHVDGFMVALRTIVLWDSHPEGQLGHIIQSAPRCQHYFLRNYFLHVQPLKCMIAEFAKPQVLVDASPAVLFTRYMDTTYLAFCNVPNRLHGTIRHFIELFQDILYQVPFKWEPEGQFLHWGECAVMCNQTPYP